MSRSRTRPRWRVAALLTGIVGLGAAGCVAVPVGGYGDPAVVVPAPPIVFAPPPVIYRPYGGWYHGRRYYGGRGYDHHHDGGRYRGGWR